MHRDSSQLETGEYSLRAFVENNSLSNVLYLWIDERRLSRSRPPFSRDAIDILVNFHFDCASPDLVALSFQEPSYTDTVSSSQMRNHLLWISLSSGAPTFIFLANYYLLDLQSMIHNLPPINQINLISPVTCLLLILCNASHDVPHH